MMQSLLINPVVSLEDALRRVFFLFHGTWACRALDKPTRNTEAFHG
jgi:hypothetical protein